MMYKILKCPIVFMVSLFLLYAQSLFAVNVPQEANVCAIQDDGKIVAAGILVANNNNEFGIARYTTNGLLDTSFATVGYTSTLIGSNAQAFAVAIQPLDGKIIIAGFAMVNNVTQVALARYSTNGLLDTSFGQSQTGIITTAIGDSANANAIALDSNNNILVAGTVVQSGTSKFFVVRYTSTGILDTNFGENGSVIIPIGARAQAYACAIQPVDGKIVVGGFSSDGISGEQFTLTRLNANGSLDSAGFGNNGIVTTKIGSQSHVNSVVAQSNGRIAVAGFSDTNYALACYTPSGALDTSFNGNGKVVRALGLKAVINGLVIDSSNNLVVTGFTDNNLLIARYTSAGALDANFNSNGENVLLFEATNVGNCLTLQSDGKIVVAGTGSNDFLLARYNTNGIIDATWGINNGVMNQPGNNSNQGITRIWEQQPAGTNAGTFTSGVWQVRNLNQLSTSDSSISLSNNQFTLGPGKYDILISVPAYRVGNHQARLQNITDGVTASYGASVFSSGSISTVSISVLGAPLVLLKPTTFQVQHKCTITEANDGLGIAAGIGAAEVYTQVKITPTS